MTDEQLMATELFKAMKSCGRYGDNDTVILWDLKSMRDEVQEEGVSPEDVLEEAGFESDYIGDLL